MKAVSETVKGRIQKELGELRREGDGRTLFRATSVSALFYFRYAKITQKSKRLGQAYFGLRAPDIDRLRGNNSFLCFVTNDKTEDGVFLLPFARFEHLFQPQYVAPDGQFKVNFYFRKGNVRALFSKQGSYVMDAYRGLPGLPALHHAAPLSAPSDMTHEGMQSLLGDIGMQRGYDLWFPRNDLGKIRGDIVESSRVRDQLPRIGGGVDDIMQNIDVIWLEGATLVSLFEVEHTTAIYSGLLRLCDVSLTYANVGDLRIVAGQMREEKFHREINRPTFRMHNLAKKVSFMSYDNAWSWREILNRSASS